ncbi:UDP-N-acetylglucosamine 1-carboxyvinyltransferase [Candidatus Daviesbacteria bacterium RIFCSPHIGHO2_01_FULL_44_29]|uniref:UDP-N-acetylglucosamine 1-carboxyvinyltransferase n=1 Tax=Candidatus Daviesbacteria bacterium RIFCSPHIGHO2_02_FULL_43_12 TaxID=1797776 RepID=A0A1F5KJJ5_9BACT|nr:MAG: UDP-N-acetylglucosamine 1-carboxyvinyltransferase [Candidatus Daviesbacteria bacterium RIFCSPHIGHO2_01_FULL_44_29]OGE39062.1 MAG: UDP-N-acetylglucosamine 1-carboxyvinyltransferase [Candidatus Daviesbacteria bacterium RIFCSPHIGHO2_12_FULL_47_45]OGE41093.1 MAG: UDP-N-acetylglucosamine 1-carboxyvinyltransferase [Candidatus Daviesbacteria bacterium RIFCSPHIGHO2_02_FULL_43_12]OGE69292.1 MAG: UDP-N-acetylglucosamine 1-carboxyvinyltransferase [Candidatus Daviesbacteria bacterium RIFCSPLOWO2_01_
MAQYVISGGNQLRGKVRISGNKNSVLPCLAATLLTEDKVTLKNVPIIRDVGVSLQILQTLGAQTTSEGREVTVEAKKISQTELPKELVAKLRASILFVGPLLARLNKVTFSHPGGDIIGRRSIEPHLDGFRALGYKFRVKSGGSEYQGYSKIHNQKILDVFLEEASVTATENLLLGCSLNPNIVILRNCAEEPHIVDLCNLLSLMGVKIQGIGSSTLTVQGARKLNGCEFSIGPDYVELGTYAIAAAITRGEIFAENCLLRGLEPLVLPLVRMGLKFEEKSGGIVMSAPRIVPHQKIHTNIWPGFPTDVMSLAIVLATQARGVTLCHDWMYENRMFFVDKLIGMGAHITIADPHRVLVYGPTKLYGRDLESPDIRAGMAMVLAALIAQGESVINRAELIERGYENVVETLLSLGANIERVD